MTRIEEYAQNVKKTSI